MRYKMVQIPSNLQVAAQNLFGKAPDTAQFAAQYLERIVNAEAVDGWEFHRVDRLSVASSPGCLGVLMGQKTVDITYSVVTFRKA